MVQSLLAVVQFLPMVMQGGIWPVAIDAQPQDLTRGGESHTASMRFVTPGFFAVLGIPLHRGRDVEESDTTDRPFAAVVSESFVRRYWPDLPDGALQPGYAGIRPKLSGPGEPASDFRIDDASVHGVAGLINLFGVESPGLTAGLAIADHVRDISFAAL